MFILSTIAINDVDDNTWSRFRQEYVLTDPIGNPGRGLKKEYDRVKQINVIPFLFWYCSILIFLLLEFSLCVHQIVLLMSLRFVQY